MQAIGRNGSHARQEWRGDFFASELCVIRDWLSRYNEIARPFRHTITVFLARTPSADFAVEPVVRLRAYADLPDFSAGAVAAWLWAEPAGKLQVKHSDGAQEHGSATLRATQDGLPVCSLGGEFYVPASVRVTARRHFAMSSEGGHVAAGASSELHRITLDAERQLFRLRDDGTLAHLGDMGPRLEIKTTVSGAVTAALKAVNVHGEARIVPWRGLELLFQSFLRDAVAPGSIVANRELELKFDLVGEIGVDALLESLRDHGEFLLPFPHRIARLRRYHICRHRTDKAGEYTIVETPSGKLSLKHKRADAQHGAVLARRTEAMFTTDRDGRACSVETFCADNALVNLNSFTKLQTKIPFRLANGHAYQISLDDCRDAAGRTLAQLEIEYIGNVHGGPTPAAVIAAELEDLGHHLLGSPFGPRLTPSTRSKHAFFRAQARAMLSLQAAMTADMKA